MHYFSNFKRTAQFFTIFGGCFFLFACGSVPVQRPAPPPTPSTSSIPSNPNSSNTTPGPTSKSGGYYMDDGPGANPPNIDAISDALPRAEALLARANRPYVVFGQNYLPMVSLAPFRQRGFASWYGRKFHGQKTSSGEIYDMYAMTAAHPTLPIPSFVRVTHARSGKSVVVRVNDRGPFLQKRVIDLSYAAAAKLGYVNAGSAEVELELITQFEGGVASDSARPGPRVVASEVVKAEPATEPTSLAIETVIAASPPAVSASGIYLQLGAFGSQDLADTTRERIQRQLDNVSEPLKVVKEGALFKLHLGPYANREGAAVIAEKIRLSTEFKPFTVQRAGS
jgi:rare lipoprotein A